MTNTSLLLITILVIMLAAVPMVMMLRNFLPAQIEKSANLDQNENRIYVLHSEIHEAQSRLSSLVARRNQRSAENHRVDTDARKAEKAIRDLENLPPMFVHEVGEPRANSTRYVVNLSLTRSSSDSAPLNPIWRCANVAEVWANTYDEAKQQVEVTFPFKLGYTKSFAKQPSPNAAKTAPTAANNSGGEGSAGAVVANGRRDEDGGGDVAPGRELRRPAMQNKSEGGGAAAPASS